ncbi:MAG: hypothetical protein ACFFG0_34425 [Candidatus Thorarchaeota archaeon]
MNVLNLKTQIDPNKLISNAKIKKIRLKEIVVKEIQQKKLTDFKNNENINLIVPLFVFNYKIINRIIKTERQIAATTIREILNHIIKNKNILYALPIDSKYTFNDIDTKSDLLRFNQEKKGKGQ